ncbi:MAG TPA: integrin alpha [Planctomycetota bacterium]|nr:integrin alpha [Planctomycetota bacterium]
MKRRLLGTAVCAAALAFAGFAQSPYVLLTVDGGQGGEALASQFSLAGLGDVDGDGVPDVAAGSPSWAAPHPTIPGATVSGVGRAGVYSGANGSPILTVLGTYNLQALGKSVANVGDLDFDGRNDVAIGAPMTGPIVPGGTPPPSQVQVWSTGTQTLLFTINGGAGGFGGANFGASIAGVGDVGSVVGGVYSAALDGYADILVGRPDAGEALMYSGADGALMYVLNAAAVNAGQPSTVLSASSAFGASTAGVGDVNGDGVPDFLVGARNNQVGGSVVVSPNTWWAGGAFLFSGSGGALLAAFQGATGDNLGFDVAGVGDMNADGVPDFALGANRADAPSLPAQSESGAVTLMSGATWTPLWTVYGLLVNDNFGYALDGAGDVNGDGAPDVVVGTPTTDVGGTNTGSATILSGVDGARLGDLHGDAASDLRGRSVSWAGDVNGDGFADVAVGAPSTDVNGSGSGSFVLASFGPYLGACAAGNIPDGFGGAFEMLRVNGTGGGLPRRVDVFAGQGFTLTFQQPPTFAAAAPYYAFGMIGTPGPADAADPGFGIGTLCFLPPALNPSDPRLFLLANSLAPADPAALLAVAAPATWVVPFATGVPFPLQVTVQAVAVDGANLLRSNAVLLNVR